MPEEKRARFTIAIKMIPFGNSLWFLRRQKQQRVKFENYRLHRCFSVGLFELHALPNLNRKKKEHSEKKNQWHFISTSELDFFHRGQQHWHSPHALMNAYKHVHLAKRMPGQAISSNQHEILAVLCHSLTRFDVIIC